MKRIVVRNLFDFESEVEDAYRIIAAFREAGYEIYLEQAQLMWEKHSLDWDAGWLTVPVNSKNIMKHLEGFYEVIDES